MKYAQRLVQNNNTSMIKAKLSTQSNIFKVKKDTTLLPFIMEVRQGISRNKAKAILSGNGVKVNGKICTRYDIILPMGTIVEIFRHKQAEQLNNKFVKIVYEDAYIIVIEKNVGILSMAANHHAFSVKSVLDEYFHRSKQKCTAHVVHRLDRDTSGLLVYAKTIQAEQILEHNWRDIVTDRRYIALISGCLPQKEGTISNWLKDNKAYFTLSYAENPGGAKWAVTHYKQIKTDGKHSIVELKLETGRKNQIRVHMQDMGCPVCGDIKYGNGDNPIGRLALHAFRLNFYHPITNEPMSFETPLPKKFLRALEKTSQEYIK